ncbi:transposase [Candidatus Uhrbacteria bacterium]|nr:transposase [Candidatus Uhrbacteria bacterium]
MRTVAFAPGEYYHIYNRGNQKQDVFRSDEDRVRFLLSLLLLQHPDPIIQLSRVAKQFVRNSVLDIPDMRQRLVELVAFTLMPNHFHCIAHEVHENGISRHMHRLLVSYTKYFNTKYEQVGHIFQGPFQAVHIEDDDQLLYCSAYIHRNPRELEGWRGREHEYPWSSYQDYVKANRWGALLQPEIVLRQTGRGNRYRRFVNMSGAKDRFMDSVLQIDGAESFSIPNVGRSRMEV